MKPRAKARRAARARKEGYLYGPDVRVVELMRTLDSLRERGREDG